MKFLIVLPLALFQLVSCSITTPRLISSETICQNTANFIIGYILPLLIQQRSVGEGLENELLTRFSVTLFFAAFFNSFLIFTSNPRVESSIFSFCACVVFILFSQQLDIN